MIKKIIKKVTRPQLPDLMAMGSLVSMILGFCGLGSAIELEVGYFTSAALIAGGIVLYIMWRKEGGR